MRHSITNYRSMGTTPSVLAGTLTAGVVAALALTLLASVRHRRRELALLKTLGYIRRQLLAAVAWQATAIAIVGVVIGVPVGMMLGHSLWVVFAHDISAVPHTTLPPATIGAVALGALALANIAAAVPARQAARTSTSWLLQADERVRGPRGSRARRATRSGTTRRTGGQWVGPGGS